MSIRDPFPDIFKTPNQFRILRVLYSASPEGLNGRQISRVAGVNPMTAHKTLQALYEIGIVTSRDVAPAKIYSINYDYFLADVVGDFIKKGDASPSLKKLGEALNRQCSYDLVSIIMFGSFARKEEGDDSDLDLLFVVKDKAPGIEYITEFQDMADKISGEQTQVIFTNSKKLIAGIKRKQGYMTSIPLEGISIYGKSVKVILSGR